jgi:hypothetical protein
MEKGFIFILERVNLPKTGDICMVYPLQHENEAFFSHTNAYISSFGEVYPLQYENEDKCVDL